MSVANDTGQLAAELRLVIGRLVRRLRAQHGFSISQGSLLGRLDREGPRGIAELAAAERVRPQSMGQTVAELDAQGLVSRRPDPDDGRRTLVELTDAGHEALVEDRARREGWLAEAIAGELSAEERETLGRAVELLARLTETK